MPLWSLNGWLRSHCTCGRACYLSLRLTPPTHEPLPPGDVIGRLRCKMCGKPPREVYLADRADTFHGAGPGVGRRIWLVR